MGSPTATNKNKCLRSIYSVSRAIGIVETQLGGLNRLEFLGDIPSTASNEDLSRAGGLPLLLSPGTAMSAPWIGAEDGRSGEESAGRMISAVVGSEGI